MYRTAAMLEAMEVTAIRAANAMLKILKGFDMVWPLNCTTQKAASSIHVAEEVLLG